MNLNSHEKPIRGRESIQIRFTLIPLSSSSITQLFKDIFLANRRRSLFYSLNVLLMIFDRPEFYSTLYILKMILNYCLTE